MRFPIFNSPSVRAHSCVCFFGYGFSFLYKFFCITLICIQHTHSHTHTRSALLNFDSNKRRDTTNIYWNSSQVQTDCRCGVRRQNCSENEVHWPFECDVLHAIDCFVILIQSTPQMICIAMCCARGKHCPILTTEEKSETQQFDYEP